MGYYDIPEELVGQLVASGGIVESFYIKDLKQRKIFITEVIDFDTVADAVRHILQINKEDMGIPVEERAPILLYLSSPGGSESAGFELIDVIECSKTPVYTINLGGWYSMGLLIGLAGHKRYASKNARFLMHDGNNTVSDSGMKVQDLMRFQSRVDARVKDYILSHSKLTEESYDKMARVEWYMFAEEAMENGFVDYIIDTNCTINEVI